MPLLPEDTIYTTGSNQDQALKQIELYIHYTREDFFNDLHKLIWQSGDLEGFASYCVLCPEYDMGIIVLTNEEDQKAPGLIEKMINHNMLLSDKEFNF